MAEWEVIEGECLTALEAMEPASVDAIVTDPPYGIGFMGHKWDQPGDYGPLRRGPGVMGFAGGRPHPNGGVTGSGGSVDAGRYDLSRAANARFQAWCEAWGREALRVLKPGGHLLSSGSPRTAHRLTAGLEDAGFEIRDSLMWLYGSGFPKSLDVSKAIDRAAGAEREVVGENPNFRDPEANAQHHERWNDAVFSPDVTAPATPEAEAWQGWGTALKPGYEPIVVARKPLDGTVAATILKHGTGALNINGCRIGSASTERPSGANALGLMNDDSWEPTVSPSGSSNGRWPANLILSHAEDCVCVGETVELWACVPGCPVRALDSQGGQSRSTIGRPRSGANGDGWGMTATGAEYDDTGGASRFFYCSKTSRAERNAGLDLFEEKPLNWSSGEQNPGAFQGDGTHRAARNDHPTVKPIDLMRWLVRLVTPPGGVVLDPFVGSGTTGCAAVLEGFRFVGVERETEYVRIARARIAWWAKNPQGVPTETVLRAAANRPGVEQLDLLG